MLSTHLIIGEITKPQGVRGELKLRPTTCDVERFEDLEQAYLQEKDGSYTPVSLRVTRVTPDAVFLFMEGVNDRDAAEKLRGRMLYMDREHAVELDEDSEFVCDLYGLRGITDDGRDIGRITDVMQLPANDVYEFEDRQGRKLLVPALKTLVERVDLEEGIMYLRGARLDEVAVTDED